MDARMNEILDKLLQWLEAAEGFAVEQTPIVLQEILAWKMAENIIYVVIALIWLSAYAWHVHRCTEMSSDDWEDATPRNIRFVTLLIIGGVGGLIWFLELCFRLPNIVQIYFAPRVFLIEYVSRLLKSE